MLIDLRGKVVCVTGSARRVGRAIMLACAEQGAHVVIHHATRMCKPNTPPLKHGRMAWRP